MSRSERLAELLKQEIGAILLSKLNDHRVGFVSITEVEVSHDMSAAKIFVSCFGTEDEKKKSIRGLMSAIPFIRGILAKNIQMRIVPHLRFIRDDSIEEGSRRIAMINKLAEERKQREESSQDNKATDQE